MHLPDVPNEVHLEDVNRALESLGIPVDKRLVDAVFTHDSIKLTFFRTTDDDEILTGSSTSLSKVETTIRIRRPKTPE